MTYRIAPRLYDVVRRKNRRRRAGRFNFDDGWPRAQAVRFATNRAEVDHMNCYCTCRRRGRRSVRRLS